MKKILILLAAVALLFTACTNGGNSSSTPSPSESSSSEASSQQPSQSSPETDPATAEEQMEPAMEAYAWCMVYSLPCDPGDTISLDGRPAYRVNDPRFPDYDSLHRYLSEIFSPEMVDNTLLSGGNYVNVDGALYSYDGARGTDVFVGGATYAMGEETDTRREIIASVEYLVDPAAETPEVERVETYTFVQEKIDGKWLFTQFPYFR